LSGGNCVGGTAVREVARQDDEDAPGNGVRVGCGRKGNLELEPRLYRRFRGLAVRQAGGEQEREEAFPSHRWSRLYRMPELQTTT